MVYLGQDAVLGQGVPDPAAQRFEADGWEVDGGGHALGAGR